MEPQTYSYTAHAKLGKVTFTYRPLINVEIGGLVERRTFKALIDSGSDITVMDKSIADVLKISLLGCPTGILSTLGNPTEGHIAPVSLQFEKIAQVFNFEVLFIENLSENFDVILGQQDFFANFDILFKKSVHQFQLLRA